MKRILKVMEVQCQTCPFREEGWTEVRGFLEERALSEASPICHSTGPRALAKKGVTPEPYLCRGARLFQASVFHKLGFLEEPTVECWDAKLRSLEE